MLSACYYHTTNMLHVTSCYFMLLPVTSRDFLLRHVVCVVTTLFKVSHMLLACYDHAIMMLLSCYYHATTTTMLLPEYFRLLHILYYHTTTMLLSYNTTTMLLSFSCHAPIMLLSCSYRHAIIMPQPCY